MDRLRNIGFKPAGSWVLEEGKLSFDLNLLESSLINREKFLYAFICNDQVQYVGKTLKSLTSRFSGYRTPGKTQTTNQKVHANIKQLLLQGEAVDICAFADSGNILIGNFLVNLPAALEDDIIKVIDPPWNGGKADAEPEPESLTSSVPLAPLWHRSTRIDNPYYPTSSVHERHRAGRAPLYCIGIFAARWLSVLHLRGSP